MPYFDTQNIYICTKFKNKQIMAKDLYFSRYLWIYDTIKNKPYIGVDDLIKRYNNIVFSGEFFKSISKRTFHRDLAEIKELFGIEIRFDKTEKGYKIDEDEMDANKILLIDSYRYIHTFQRFNDINKYIASEAVKTGSEHLTMMLEAIKLRRSILFSYQKYVCSEVENRKINPYFIKEYKSRWYVVAADCKDRRIKTFALERMNNIQFTLDGASSYDIPKDITPDNFFDDTFGIFKMPDLQVEEVILSFKPLKGKFIESNPMHKSQEMLIKNDDELRIRLKLQLTHDLKMEILSHGDEVRVIAPESLIKDIRSIMENALKQYIN
jgi:predicted DNA-binding transcriptional regulator YafY